MRPLSQIVAVAENGVIGRDQALPWHLPSDLKRFKALTLGKPILMGRHTYVSIGRPLPGRISVVVGTDPAFAPPPEVRVARTLEEALALAEAAAQDLGADEVMVIGGRRIFADTLPLAHLVHLTQVHAAPEGDVRLPPFDPAVWRERDREGPLQGPGDDLPFSYVTLERI
ncbi:dihydrofolate reductase [Azorhizobium doebereinerae]|uniref:dihydrofolate reductase n=1 Tax=Azorhizobium doebereinerae TaxID=281091 RepID=UPI0004122907|nr:dihydrofolate reductase [Azorhizobium doebereinerae]